MSQTANPLTRLGNGLYPALGVSIDRRPYILYDPILTYIYVGGTLFVLIW